MSIDCNNISVYKSPYFGTEEMVQWLKTLVALAEDQGPILSTQMVVHNCNLNYIQKI